MSIAKGAGLRWLAAGTAMGAMGMWAAITAPGMAVGASAADARAQAAADRAEIEQLMMGDYPRALDGRGLEDPTARSGPATAQFIYRGNTYTGPAAIAAVFDRPPAPAAAGAAATPPGRTQHVVTNLTLKLSGDRAVSQAYWQTLGVRAGQEVILARATTRTSCAAKTAAGSSPSGRSSTTFRRPLPRRRRPPAPRRGRKGERHPQFPVENHPVFRSSDPIQMRFRPQSCSRGPALRRLQCRLASSNGTTRPRASASFSLKAAARTCSSTSAAVERAGHGDPMEGDRISYDLEKGRDGRESAINLRAPEA